MIKYLKVLFFSYDIYKVKNQKKYNSSKTPDFRHQYNNLKQHHYILIYESHCCMNIAVINLKNKSHYCFLSKYFNIQVNYFYSRHHLLSIQVYHFPKSSLLYYKIYAINKINLYTEFNIYTKINKSLTTISQLLVRSLLSSTQKNSHNLISCTRLKTNLMGLEIILCSN